MKIHPSAIVSPGAQLADDVEVGPYTIIGENVSIGSGTRIDSGCIIDGDTEIGSGCRIFTGAIIGTPPQDLKYQGERTRIVIGENNVIREYVTINLATGEGNVTSIGSNNLLMAYSHIAHNSSVGNGVVIANCGTLAGHVAVEDRAIVGGLVAIHQFVRVGTLAIIGGCSKVVQDVPPYSLVDGHPSKLFGVNSVGLKRAGVSNEIRASLKTALKLIINPKLSTPHALEKIKQELPPSQEINHLVEFIQNSRRGICR